MSMKNSYVIYRPVRTYDGEGGHTDSYEDPRNVWGVVTVEETETRMHVDPREDILIDDVVEVEEEV